MDESTYRLWDIAIKSLVILAGIWAVIIYFNAGRIRKEISEKEFRQPLWEKQLELFFKTTEATATIATLAPEDSRRVAAQDTFYMLYFGPLAIVEDLENVERAMALFKKRLEGGGAANRIYKDVH